MVKRIAKRMVALLIGVCGALALALLGGCGPAASQEGYLAGVVVELANPTGTQQTSVQFLDVETGKEIAYKDLYYLDGRGDEYVAHASSGGRTAADGSVERTIYIGYRESRKTDAGVTFEAGLSVTLEQGETLAYRLSGSKLVLSGKPVANPAATALQNQAAQSPTTANQEATPGLSLNPNTFAADYQELVTSPQYNESKFSGYIKYSPTIEEASPDYGYSYAFVEGGSVYFYLSKDGTEVMVTNNSPRPYPIGLFEVLLLAGVDQKRAEMILLDVESDPRVDVSRVIAYEDLGLEITVLSKNTPAPGYVEAVLKFS